MEGERLLRPVVESNKQAYCVVATRMRSTCLQVASPSDWGASLLHFEVYCCVWVKAKFPGAAPVQWLGVVRLVKPTHSSPTLTSWIPQWQSRQLSPNLSPSLPLGQTCMVVWWFSQNPSYFLSVPFLHSSCPVTRHTESSLNEILTHLILFGGLFLGIPLHTINTVVLKPPPAFESPGRPVKTQIAGPRA